MSLLVFTALSLSFAGGPAGEYLTPPPLPDLPPITRYVAPETGNDAADGLTPETAWRHPPGDSRATHGWTPTAGAHVAMKGGENYRGRFSAVSGVTYSGNQWGAGRCTIDGSRPVSVRTPTSMEDAGGHPDWASGAILIAEWDADGLPFRTTLFDEYGALALASARRNPEPWMRTDIDRHPGLTYDGLGSAEMRDNFRIPDATLAADCAGEAGRAQLWIRTSNNQYVQRTVTAVGADTTEFDPSPWQNSSGGYVPPYVDDNQRVLLFNCVKHVTQPGDYAVLSDGKAIFRSRGDVGILRGVTDTSTSTWPGLNISNQSSVQVRGFRFARFVNRPLFRTGVSVSGWRIEGNLFEWMELWDNGAIVMSSVSGATVSQNRFRYFIHDSNCIVSGGSNNETDWNVCHSINATAIQMFSDGTGNKCRNNIVSDANGVHGNGISLYRGQRNTTVQGNIVYDCMRPLTTQGTPAGVSGRVFEGNLFHCTARGNGWAWWHNGTAAIDSMELRRNLCIGWAAGIRIDAQTVNTVLYQNWSTNGVAGGKAGMPPGVCVAENPTNNQGTWAANDNEAIALTYLSDVGALLEVDRANILCPDGSRMALDLRGVAA